MQGIVRDKFIIIGFLLSVTLSVIALFIGLTSFYGYTGKIIVGTPGGEPALGDIESIYYTLLMLAFILIINFFLSYNLYFRDKRLSYVFIFANLLVNTAVLIFLYILNSLN